MDAIIKAIEDYIQVVTSRKCNALDDALEKLEGLERDLDGIITDVKEERRLQLGLNLRRKKQEW